MGPKYGPHNLERWFTDSAPYTPRCPDFEAHPHNLQVKRGYGPNLRTHTSDLRNGLQYSPKAELGPKGYKQKN